MAIAAAATTIASSAMAAALPGTTLTPSVWFDASQIQGVNNGQTISGWNDASGNGRNAYQPVAVSDPNRLPTYRTNVINGRPTVRFNDNADVGITNLNQFLAFNQPLANTAGSNMDLYVVSGSTDAVISGRGATISTRPPAAGGGFFFGYNADTVAGYFHPGHQHGGNSELGVGPGGVHVLNIRANPDPSADPRNFNVMALDRSGLTEDLATFSDGGGIASTVTWTGFTASGSDVTYIATQNADSFFRGDIAEIIAFEGGISAEDRRQVIGYLGQKYSIDAAAALVPEPTGVAALLCVAGGLLARRRAW